MTDKILVHDEGAVRDVRISNPSKRNALTRELLADLSRALPSSQAGPDQPIRVVILRGDPAGSAFSSGFDIGAIDDKERERGLDPICEPADALERCPVPVIAALDGPAFGGGLEIAMACDLRVARAGTKLCMPPARLGLVYSATGLQRFLRAAGPSACKRLFLTGEPVLADEAVRFGLVDVVVHQGSAFDAARAWAERIAENAPLAVTGLLDAIRRLSRPGGPDDGDFAAIAEARERTVSSEDLQEGVLAFAEKRKPKFQGR